MLQVITRGEVKEHGAYYYLDSGKESWTLGGWAKDYVGKTLVICLEEKEPEPSPKLEMVAVPA